MRATTYFTGVRQKAARCKNDKTPIDVPNSGSWAIHRRKKGGQLGRADVACPRALTAPASAIFDNFEFDALPLLQGVEGAVGDRRYMEENVTLSRVGGNESETAILHEFLDGALWHVKRPLIMKPR
jgi:hypothetical protein